MSSIAARYSDLLSAVAACCDRLVAPSVEGAVARARLVRLGTSLILASFTIAAACAVVGSVLAGPGAVLAAVSGILAAYWLMALIAVSGKAEGFISALAIGSSSIVLAVLVTLGGGAASPLFLLMAGLLAEPVWIRRTPRSAWLGAAALTASIALLAVFGEVLPAVGAAAHVGYWFPVIAYLLTNAARFAPTRPVTTSAAPDYHLVTSRGGVVVEISSAGEITEVHGDTSALFGIAPELLCGEGLFERVLVADRVPYLCALSDMRAGAKLRRVEILVRVASSADIGSSYRPFEIELLPAGADGDGAFGILNCNDKLDYLRGQIEQAESRCDELGTARNKLLASVSHELRTPLSAIIGFSDMLLLELAGPFSDPRQKEYVKLVRDSGNHLLDVVNSLLDVSKIESGAYTLAAEEFRLGDAVDMSLAMMAGHASAKSITLRSDLAYAPFDLVADRRAVQQMLINLLSNAIKFTPVGGEVVVRAVRHGASVALSVADNGIGIAEDDLARLGEPFTQVQNDYTREFDGAGLGLSLVKGLVGLHRGAMSIESALDEGTTVTVTLPINGPEGEPKKQAQLIALSSKRAGEGGYGGFRKTA